MTKHWIRFSILVAFIAVVGCLIAAGSYPVIFVNGRSVSYKSFKRDYAMAVFYYRKALETYDSSQLPVMDSSEVRQEIERAVLEQCVENTLVSRELKSQLKNKQIEAMIEGRISETLADKEIKKEEIKALFNLSVEDFKEIVLKPQAKKEILSGRLFLNNKNLEDWLKESKSGAKVIVLLSDFEWKDAGVAIK